MGEQMIVGLLTASLASAETVENTPIHASSLLDVPAQSWEEDTSDAEQAQVNRQAQQQMKIGLMVGGSALLATSGFAFYMKDQKREEELNAIREFGSLEHPEVQDLDKSVGRYSVLAYGGLLGGLSMITGGVVLHVQPTSVAVSLEF